MQQAELVPAEPKTSEQPDATGLALIVERLAANPTVDVAKLEKIIELQERMLKHQAVASFTAAFSKMQPEIPIIDEHGRIEVRGSVRSTYAPLEDIHEVIKPILARHGFAIRHRTEWPAEKPNIIRIVGILGHEHGHSEESVFEAPMDKSEFRSDIQSMGSTVSYGRRYTTLDLLNIATRKADKDGQRKQTVPQNEPKAPAGYDNWLDDLTAAADNGWRSYCEAWNGDNRKAFRHFLNSTAPQLSASLKAKAQEVRS